MAHPDDAELLCGGAITKSATAGKRVGVLDLTAGEMGSAGSIEQRAAEAAHASQIMGLTERRNAGLPDAVLENDNESRHVLVEHIRALRPSLVVTHWKVGRHRDHRITSELVRDACFLSGLKKLDAPGEPFRPTKLIYATAFREDAAPPPISSSTSANTSTRSSRRSTPTRLSSRASARPEKPSPAGIARWKIRSGPNSLTMVR